MSIINYLQSKFLKKSLPKQQVDMNVTWHDYIRQTWGHSIDLSNFKGTDQNGVAFQKSFRCNGFGPLFSGRLLDNDIIVVKMASGYVGVFEVWNVKYNRDPRDLWFADAKWLGYPRPNNAQVPMTVIEYYEWQRV